MNFNFEYKRNVTDLKKYIYINSRSWKDVNKLKLKNRKFDVKKKN